MTRRVHVPSHPWGRHSGCFRSVPELSMSRLALVCLVAALSASCMAHRVRQEAQLALDCRTVSVTQHTQTQAWMAVGCGRTVICSTPGPDEPRADVQCEG